MAPKSELVPKKWPPGVVYLSESTHCTSLTPSHIAALRTQTKDAQTKPPDLVKGPSPLVKITSITSSSHQAFGQCGLFASKNLKPGSFILQYMGEIHATPSSQESPSDIRVMDDHAASNYDLSLDRELGIGIDADKKGNEARFINDYRGVKDRSNAEFKEIWDGRKGERGMGVWVLSEGRSGKQKGIRKGEEILVSYGRGFWGARKGDENQESMA